MKPWRPDRDGLRYVVKQLVFADFAGSGYRFAREGDTIQRFWFRKNAQAYADKLNAEQASSPPEVE